jgi:geranylgeranyl diphosphate synthase, type I
MMWPGGPAVTRAQLSRILQVNRLADPQSNVEASTWYVACRDRVAPRLREIVGDDPGVTELWRYHMGWADAEGRPIASDAGKMLRPVLCLTACEGFGGSLAVIDIAAAIELLHAFSLVHDDIEDGDRERRHRTTLWALTGIPLALNAGDGLFAKAFEALQFGMVLLERDEGLRAMRLYLDGCLGMIEGQHMDIGFEARTSVALEEYVGMVRGKTGALIGASLALGALCGGARPSQVEDLRAAGVDLGLAFQAADDALAFWGDPAQTGKAVGNDLARGKKSLPLVLAVESGLSVEAIEKGDLDAVLGEFERLGVRESSAGFARECADRARRAIETVGLSSTAVERLVSLVDFAVVRDR